MRCINIPWTQMKHWLCLDPQPMLAISTRWDDDWSMTVWVSECDAQAVSRLSFRSDMSWALLDEISWRRLCFIILDFAYLNSHLKKTKWYNRGCKIRLQRNELSRQFVLCFGRSWRSSGEGSSTFRGIVYRFWFVQKRLFLQELLAIWDRWLSHVSIPRRIQGANIFRLWSHRKLKIGAWTFVIQPYRERTSMVSTSQIEKCKNWRACKSLYIYWVIKKN